MSMMSIFPNEVLFHIFSFLSFKDLENVAHVCNTWCNASNSSKEKILEVVENVLKNGYNELVDKHHREGFYGMVGSPPMKKAEKIIIKNLKSGVCKILTKDADDSMYYQIPSELLQKLLFTTNIKSVNSLRKLPEDGKWIRKYKCHRKFFFPCKTFVEVFSSIYSNKRTEVGDFSMIDISDFEKNSDDLPHVGRERKYLVLLGSALTGTVILTIEIAVRLFAGFFCCSNLLMIPGIVCAGGGAITTCIAAKIDQYNSPYIYLSFTAKDNDKETHTYFKLQSLLENSYLTNKGIIKKVMMVYKGKVKLSSNESDEIRRKLVDSRDPILKMYIQRISTKKPELLNAFQTLFPQAWMER